MLHLPPPSTRPDAHAFGRGSQALPLPWCSRATGNLDAGTVGRSLRSAWMRGQDGSELALALSMLLSIAAVTTSHDLDSTFGLVCSHILAMSPEPTASMIRMRAEIARFHHLLEAHSVTALSEIGPQHVLDFIEQPVVRPTGGWADPSVSTMRLRRTALRFLFRTARPLGLIDGDPSIDIALPGRVSSSTRPLADEEETLGRIWSERRLFGATRHPAAWAIGQATATNSEQAAVTVADLDLDEGRVWLHGNESRRTPRWGQLTPWGIVALEARVRVIGTSPETLLLTSARASRNAAQASTNSLIHQTLTNAGLLDGSGTTPASLPNWAGRQVFEVNQRIDEAAHALGVRSLDTAAQLIGWDW